jgi:tetratricopeptide (TPR) repeat protein
MKRKREVENQSINQIYASAYLQRGDAYFQYQKALENFNQAIALNPNDAMAYYYRGDCNHRLGNTRAALQDFTSAIQLNFEFEAAYHSRGKIYHEIGHFQESIEDFSQAMRLNPKNILYYQNTGVCYHALGHYREAIAWFEMALALEQNHESYLYCGASCYAMGNFDIAIQNYKEALCLNSQNARGFCGLGICYYQQGEYELAEENFEKAMQLNNDYILTYVWRAQLYEEWGKMDLAKADFAKATQRFAQSYYHLACRGVAKLKCHDPESALNDFNDALAKHPRYLFALVNRAFAKVALNDMQDARTDLEQAILWPASSVMDYFWQANAIAYLKQWNEALHKYDQTLSMRPHFPEALARRGWVKWQCGRYGQAQREWEKIKQLAPHYPIKEFLQQIETQIMPTKRDEKAQSVNQSGQLPIETWVYIFSFLKPSELVTLALVSQQWKSMAENESLWHLQAKALTGVEIFLMNKKYYGDMVQKTFGHAFHLYQILQDAQYQGRNCEIIMRDLQNIINESISALALIKCLFHQYPNVRTFRDYHGNTLLDWLLALVSPEVIKYVLDKEMQLLINDSDNENTTYEQEIVSMDSKTNDTAEAKADYSVQIANKLKFLTEKIKKQQHHQFLKQRAQTEFSDKPYQWHHL